MFPQRLNLPAICHSVDQTLNKKLLEKETVFHFPNGKGGKEESGMAHCREHSPPTNVAWVRFFSAGALIGDRHCKLKLANQRKSNEILVFDFHDFHYP